MKPPRPDGLAGRRFLKMNGIGNAIVVMDLRGTPALARPEEVRAVAAVCPFDQLMALHDPRSPDTAAFVRIYNRDGSASGACGNGTRCVAWALARDGGPDRLAIETEAGRLACVRLGPETFSVDMGAPRFDWSDIPLAGPVADTRAIELRWDDGLAPPLAGPSAVSMGNPHAVFWVEDPAAYDLGRLGPALEIDPMFPEHANISLARIVDRGHIVLRVWERGAGLTRACGSAACAAAVAAARLGRVDRMVRVSLPGGDLTIEWRADGHVWMTGGVAFEFEGVLPESLADGLAA